MYIILVYSVFGSDRNHCSGFILQLKNISSFWIYFFMGYRTDTTSNLVFIKYSIHKNLQIGLYSFHIFMIYYIVSDSGNNEWIVYQPSLWIVVPNFKLIFCIFLLTNNGKSYKSLCKMSPRKDNSDLFYN